MSASIGTLITDVLLLSKRRNTSHIRLCIVQELEYHMGQADGICNFRWVVSIVGR